MKLKIVHVARRALWAACAPTALLMLGAWAEPPAKTSLQETHYGRSGVDLTARDLTVRPGDDFDEYASGGWRRHAVIPADELETGSFSDMDQRTQARLRAILEEAAAKPKDPTARMLGDLYSAFTDEAAVEAAGDSGLKAQLAEIRAASDRSALAELMGRSHRDFSGSFFALDRRVDQTDPKISVLRLRQAGLGMADREVYLADAFKPQRKAYRDYAARTLALIGWPDPERAADDILALETRIAQASWSLSESRDRRKMYNPMRVEALAAEAPGFDWRAFLRGAGVGELDSLVIGQRSAMPKIAAVFAETPPLTLQAWLAFQTTDQASQYMPSRYVENWFSFRGKEEQGLEQNQPRWKRGVYLVSEQTDKALGREYVARWFPPESKARMEAMVANLKTAMSARIERLEWMSPHTKAEALDKLKRLRVMVGYPDRWRDYTGLSFDRRDLYGDVRRAKAFNWRWDMGKLKEPVDPNEWWLPPQIIDAYSDFSRVVIVFPAGMLQSPYFDPQADPAASYGAIGAVIGHEITHQFDDQGRKGDGEGRLRDWWEPEDAKRFDAAAAKLVEQFNHYEVVPGVFQNGKQTLGENIADLGGILLALEAYHASLGGKPAPVIDGLTGDQRVFLGWACFWRAKIRPEVLKQQAVSNVHAMPNFRLIGSTRNVDVWYKAFAVKPGERYYLKPEERVRIW